VVAAEEKVVLEDSHMFRHGPDAAPGDRWAESLKRVRTGFLGEATRAFRRFGFLGEALELSGVFVLSPYFNICRCFFWYV
jgi:hypothetical protein